MATTLKQDLILERRAIIDRYKLQLKQITDRVEQAEAKLEQRGAISTHDAFNISSQVQELQGLASKFELIEMVIRTADQKEAL